MQTFDQALYDHVEAGRVSVEDALRVASSPHDFKLLVDAQGRRGTTMADVPARSSAASARRRLELPPQPVGARSTAAAATGSRPCARAVARPP